MAYISPADLKTYTVFQKVKDRLDPNLTNDIVEAEADLETQLGKGIEETLDGAELPAVIKIALLKTAEFYALINSDESRVKGIKSESLGDYSYTLSDGVTLTKPDVSNLIRKYKAFSGTFRFRMRGV